MLSSIKSLSVVFQGQMKFLVRVESTGRNETNEVLISFSYDRIINKIEHRIERGICVSGQIR